MRSLMVTLWNLLGVRMNRKNAGKWSQKQGHLFEHKLSTHLSEIHKNEFVVHGGNRTKVDIMSGDGEIRLSVKNPSGKNTQIGLMTQKSFIDSMGITDNNIVSFISKFFGGDNCDSFPRHRMSKSDIDDKSNRHFVDYLNTNKEKIYDILFTCGHNQDGDVNWLAWATKKNCVDDVLYVDLNNFRSHFTKGVWSQRETTFVYTLDGKKLLHLQMKGSGKKYSNSYHGLMFHVYGGNINERFITNGCN